MEVHYAAKLLCQENCGPAAASRVATAQPAAK